MTRSRLPGRASSGAGRGPRGCSTPMRRSAPDLRGAAATRAVLARSRAQEDAGVDIVTDGEQRRDNFYSFLCERSTACELMTLAELLDHVEDKAAFENLLRALDVPAFAIKNPTVVGKLARARGRWCSTTTGSCARTRDAPIKVTLPGPVPAVPLDVGQEALGARLPDARGARATTSSRILREELRELAAAGADVVQFDEPVLTELVFAGKSATRTFMCAALAAAASPESELELAVELDQPRRRRRRGPADGAARLPRQLEPQRGRAARGLATTPLMP